MDDNLVYIVVVTPSHYDICDCENGKERVSAEISKEGREVLQVIGPFIGLDTLRLGPWASNKREQDQG